MAPFAGAYRGRRVLVTGHTGFKGSWLALWLSHLGAEVVGYSLPASTEPAIFEILDMPTGLKHCLGDIRDRDRLAEVLDESRPEMVFHLAAQPLVLASLNDPVETFETNAMGMVNLLECLRERPWINAAVLVTSDKAYRNDELQRGYRETDHLGGHDPYSGSKSCAELIAHSYHYSFLRESPTCTATARAGNVIGGGDWAVDRVVPDCIRAWSRGQAVAIRNPASTRPWQHVLEPLSGYLLLGSQLMNKNGNLDGESFNFGPGEGQDETVANLLELMADRWPGADWVGPDEAVSASQEASLLKLSCDKALGCLGWQAVLDFEETVSMTVDWYRAWYEGKTDLRQLSLEQIGLYMQRAQASGMTWGN